MTKKAFEQIMAGAQEALAIARGEVEPARWHVPLETYPWDVTDHLDTPEAIAGYLVAAIEAEIADPMPGSLARVLEVVQRARARFGQEPL